MSNEKYTQEELEAMVNSEDWKEREKAAEAGYALERLVDDEDEDVRIAVAKQANKLGQENIFEQLITDKDRYVREAVAELARKIGKDKWLKQILADNENSYIVELNSDRKLINRVKKAGINTYNPQGEWNGFGYTKLPLVAEITSLVEMHKFNEIEKEVKEERNKEKNKISNIELSQKNVAEALYSVNKEAKRQRNIKDNAINDAYGDGYEYTSVHSVLHTAKYRMNNLYDLKNEALEIAIKKWNLEPLGYHEFADCNRDMYEFGGYQFHMNENTSEKNLGAIEEEISAERKRSFPPKKAEKILRRFIAEN